MDLVEDAVYVYIYIYNQSSENPVGTVLKTLNAKDGEMFLKTWLCEVTNGLDPPPF